MPIIKDLELSEETLNSIMRNHQRKNKTLGMIGKRVNFKHKRFNVVSIPNDVFLNKSVFQMCEFINFQAANTKFNSSEFINCLFQDSNLEGINLINTLMNDTQYKNTNMKNCNLENTDMSNNLFVNVDISNSNLNNSNLEGSVFIDTDLSNSILSNSNIKKAKFVRCTIDGVNFNNSIIDETIFDSIKETTRTLFTNASMNKVLFYNSLLSPNVDLTNSDFYGLIIAQSEINDECCKNIYNYDKVTFIQ